MHLALGVGSVTVVRGHYIDQWVATGMFEEVERKMFTVCGEVRS